MALPNFLDPLTVHTREYGIHQPPTPPKHSFLPSSSTIPLNQIFHGTHATVGNLHGKSIKQLGIHNVTHE